MKLANAWLFLSIATLSFPLLKFKRVWIKPIAGLVAFIIYCALVSTSIENEKQQKIEDEKLYKAQQTKIAAYKKAEIERQKKAEAEKKAEVLRKKQAAVLKTQAEKKFKELIKLKIVRYYEPENRAVYVEPAAWLFADIKTKEGFGKTCGILFDWILGEDFGRCEILDTMSGKKLAHYDVWGFKAED